MTSAISNQPVSWRGCENLEFNKINLPNYEIMRQKSSTFLFCLCLLGPTCCLGQTQESTHREKDLFEIKVQAPTSKPGEFVLCPSRQFFDSALEKGADKTSFIYYAAKMIRVGKYESEVRNLAGHTFRLPNQLIISIPPRQVCKVGDILLTWWQSGSGMKRAIVVGGTATFPIVRYLDIKLDNPSGAGKKEDALKPDTFVVLNKPWQLGTSVYVDDGRQPRHGQLVAVSEQHVLVREFAGKLKCYDKSKANPIPIVPNVTEGDNAMAALYGGFKPVTVTKIDSKIGRVFAKFQLGRKDQEKVIPFGDIFKKK